MLSIWVKLSIKEEVATTEGCLISAWAAATIAVGIHLLFVTVSPDIPIELKYETELGSALCPPQILT